ncbi:hypothetical protein FB45DRAFT_873653 [Roridomyces roridus]|uniref:Uncharacterized protein n=1 Tax=Roridomyces roridus TaxID=1738132 RepID=A0AAD7BAF5_9AGAR|nr:hypothetical protein FB45DRAFT_873653 [Roridomyces roridus]
MTRTWIAPRGVRYSYQTQGGTTIRFFYILFRFSDVDQEDGPFSSHNAYKNVPRRPSWPNTIPSVAVFGDFADPESARKESSRECSPSQQSGVGAASLGDETRMLLKGGSGGKEKMCPILLQFILWDLEFNLLVFGDLKEGEETGIGREINAPVRVVAVEMVAEIILPMDLTTSCVWTLDGRTVGTAFRGYKTSRYGYWWSGVDEDRQGYCGGGGVEFWKDWGGKRRGSGEGTGVLGRENVGPSLSRIPYTGIGFEFQETLGAPGEFPEIRREIKRRVEGLLEAGRGVCGVGGRAIYVQWPWSCSGESTIWGKRGLDDEKDASGACLTVASCRVRVC